MVYVIPDISMFELGIRASSSVFDLQYRIHNKDVEDRSITIYRVHDTRAGRPPGKILEKLKSAKLGDVIELNMHPARWLHCDFGVSYISNPNFSHN